LLVENLLYRYFLIFDNDKHDERPATLLNESIIDSTDRRAGREMGGGTVRIRAYSK